jgi:hypothetical protein
MVTSEQEKKNRHAFMQFRVHEADEEAMAIIRIITAPKLQILGSLSYGIAQLHLGATVFQVVA